MTDTDMTAAPEFIDPSRRLAIIDLDYPLALAGRTFDRVMIRRMTVQEVADFADALKAVRETDPDRVVPWPMYFDVDGNRLPAALLSALDDDDSEKLEKVVADFLPRRFRESQTE